MRQQWLGSHLLEQQHRLLLQQQQQQAMLQEQTHRVGLLLLLSLQLQAPRLQLQDQGLSAPTLLLRCWG
jgi:hypothetical protein